MGRVSVAGWSEHVAPQVVMACRFATLAHASLSRAAQRELTSTADQMQLGGEFQLTWLPPVKCLDSEIVGVVHVEAADADGRGHS